MRPLILGVVGEWRALGVHVLLHFGDEYCISVMGVHVLLHFGMGVVLCVCVCRCYDVTQPSLQITDGDLTKHTGIWECEMQIYTLHNAAQPASAPTLWICVSILQLP